MMIKKKIKKWYPTKQRETEALILNRIQEAASHIYNNRREPAANWVVVGHDSFNILNNWSYTTSGTCNTYIGIPTYSASTYNSFSGR